MPPKYTGPQVCIDCGKGEAEVRIHKNQRICTACVHLRQVKKHGEHGAYLRKRKTYLKRHYNITIDEYEDMLAQQAGGCAICGSCEPGNKRNKVLHVDHDHTTGAVRGLLCQSCNHMLGGAKDDTSILRRGIMYLEKEV